MKTVKFKDPVYLGDPINIVKIFNEKEIDELILLDITATLEAKQPNFEILSKIASECFVPLGYGGGIQSLNVMEELFYLGFEKVILNSIANEKPQLILEAAKRFGSQSIVVSMDVKKSIFGKYEVFTHSGRKRTKLPPDIFAERMEDMGAGEIIVNSIDRDGSLQGYDNHLLKLVSSSVGIPVIACGGAGKLEDLAKAVHEAGVSAVAAGSMFVFQGRHRAVLITYPSEAELQKIFPNRSYKS